MKLRVGELHDPLFCLDDVVEKPSVVDSLYEKRVTAYWIHRYQMLEGGAYPTVSEMVWQG